MALLKKTFVLAKNGNKGFVTVICIGGSIGVKISVKGVPPFTVGIKIGENPIFIERLTAEYAEYNYENAEFPKNGYISCVVLQGREVYCEGGTGYVGTGEVLRKIDEETVTEESGAEESDRETVEKSLSEPTASEPDEAIEREKEADPESTFKNEDNVAETSEDTLECLKQLRSAENFYYSIKDRIDELFVANAEEKALAAVIENSKWVKVNYEGEDYYVVGKLFFEKTPVCICYGVPGIKCINPPKEARSLCRWFPVDGLPKYEGYWIIFQDAETGEIIFP